MSHTGPRKHALFPRLRVAGGPPFLPQVGQLYLLSTAIFSLGNDPAADRPAVVIEVPSAGSRRSIFVATRTSQAVSGVEHPRDPGLGCDKDGVFADLASVEPQLWHTGNVTLQGILPEPYLSQVLRRFL